MAVLGVKVEFVEGFPSRFLHYFHRKTIVVNLVGIQVSRIPPVPGFNYSLKGHNSKKKFYSSAKVTQ